MASQVAQNPTLVLNRDWRPVNIATVGRALTLTWNQAARIVDPTDFRLYDWEEWSWLVPREGEPYFQTTRRRLRVPEVIVLARYDRSPTVVVSFNRRNLFERDHWACQYCGQRPNVEDRTIDHVVPRSRGGISTWENCVLACMACNKRKGDRTPSQAGMKLCQAPRRPNWKPIQARAATPIASWSKFLGEENRFAVLA